MRQVLRFQGSDPDINEAIIYFRLAYEFGWTPQEIDIMPATLVDDIIMIVNELDEERALEIKRMERDARRRR